MVLTVSIVQLIQTEYKASLKVTITHEIPPVLLKWAKFPISSLQVLTSKSRKRINEKAVS